MTLNVSFHLLFFACEENCSPLHLFALLATFSLPLFLSLFSFLYHLNPGRTHHEQHTHTRVQEEVFLTFSKSLIFYFTILYLMFFHHLFLSLSFFFPPVQSFYSMPLRQIPSVLVYTQKNTLTMDQVISFLHFTD